MRIGRPTHVMHGPYPELHVTIDGVPVVLHWDQQKPTLTDAGLVYLGPDFEARLDPIDFEVPGEPGNVLTLRGFTRDPGVAAVYREFLAACRGEPRPMTRVEELMMLLGVDRMTAEFCEALEKGETDGDLVVIDDPAEEPPRDERPTG